MIISITTVKELKAIRAENDKVVLKFSSAQCAPCKAQTKIFEAMSKDKETKDILFVDIDIADGYEIVKYYEKRGFPIRAVPSIVTYYNFEGGDQTGRHVGLTSKDQILRHFAEE